MKHPVAKYILTVLLICFVFKIEAKQITFSHYKLGRGLPASLLMQDRKGYLWIASDGLFRFDGVNSVHYVYDPKLPNSLANNGIRSICEAPDGTVWIGTMNGISHYNPATDKFTNYLHKTGSNANVDNVVFADDDGTIWVGNREGIARFDKKKKTFAPYDLAKYQQSGRKGSGFISCMIQDKADKNWLWLGTYNGLIHFRKKDGFAVYYYCSTQPCTINKLFMDSRNRLWVGTWGNGLGLFDTQTKTFVFRQFVAHRKDGTTNIVQDICEQRIKGKSSFYLCTEIGLIVFKMDDSAQTFRHTDLSHVYAFSNILPNGIGGRPYGILKDRQGIIWVATDKDLSYILPANQAFAHYSLQTGFINNITEGQNEHNRTIYWISAWYGKGLAYADSSFGRITQAHYFDKLIHSPDSRQINGVIEVGSELWVATMDGLFLYDKTTHKSSVFFKSDGLPENRICALAYDHKNKLLWIGTYDKGLFLFDPKAHKTVPLPFSIPALSGGRINMILEDGKGRMWLGDESTLYRFNENYFRFKTYKHIAGDLHSKAGGDITAIAEDAQHRIWIATRQGLNLYNENSDNFLLFTTSDGLSNNGINSLVPDNNDNMWIATAKGLDCMNTHNFSIKSYYNENGLADDNDLNCLLANRAGAMIIGGNNLLSVFRPDALIINTQPPQVYITSLKLNNTHQLFIINGSDKKVNLKYNQNYFTIDFVALNFINAADNQYAYQLQGVDQDFVHAGHTRSVTYANIAPGTYTFKVKAANNDGVWNEGGASITLVIAPPFWKTWWFIAICVLLALLIAYAAYNYRVNQLLQLERLRTKISTDLHDEIGSTLSAISILSSMAVHQQDAPQTAQMLHEINDSAADLMQKMDDIVWAINPKNDSLENLLLRTKNFAVRLFEARNMDYNIDIPKDIASVKLPMETRQHLYLMIKESINNVMKHSGCSFVRIVVGKNNHALHITVEDNGKGFDPKDTFYGNGLLSLQNRAKLIHAHLSIYSQPGKGTTITVTLKIV